MPPLDIVAETLPDESAKGSLAPIAEKTIAGDASTVEMTIVAKT